MKALTVLKYTGFGILGVGFIALTIWLVMALWNWLVPGLFNGPVINYWQTAGLFLLSKIFLTGIAPGGQGHRKDKTWKGKYHEKYGHCYPEEEKTVRPEQG
jgi:hypothetical protein